MRFSLSTRECSRSRNEMEETMTRAFVMFSRAERSVQQRSQEVARMAVRCGTCTRDRDVMLYEADVNIGTPVSADRF